MSGHTPGPWAADIDGAHHRAVVRHGMTPLAEMWMTGQPQAEREANARLIAAAPELLEALQWYVDNDDTNIGQPGNEPYEAGLNRARAAIAKATD